MKFSSLPVVAAALFVAVTAVACGGGSSTPTTPTPPTSTTPPPTTAPPTTAPPTDSATITIGADGRVSPSSVTIVRGGRVTMINNHNTAHDMSSDPHPEHSNCPELNQWGFLTAGQQRTSGNLNTARTCGFHDHNVPQNTGLQGTVIIQ
jgi:hypothetical protein